MNIGQIDVVRSQDDLFEVRQQPFQGRQTPTDGNDHVDRGSENSLGHRRWRKYCTGIGRGKFSERQRTKLLHHVDTLADRNLGRLALESHRRSADRRTYRHFLPGVFPVDQEEIQNVVHAVSRLVFIVAVERFLVLEEAAHAPRDLVHVFHVGSHDFVKTLFIRGFDRSNGKFRIRSILTSSEQSVDTGFEMFSRRETSGGESQVLEQRRSRLKVSFQDSV